MIYHIPGPLRCKLYPARRRWLCTPYRTSCKGSSAPSRRISPKLENPDPAQWFNPAAFVNRLDFVANVGPYRYGNSQRNNIIGPGLVALDGSLFKSFKPTERVKIDLRAEFFNLPNHPNFGQPNATVGSANYARITSTRTAARQIQLGLRMTF